MDDARRALRTRIRSMSHDRAVDFIKRFHLLPDEEAYLIASDVQREYNIKIAMDNHVSPEVISRKRRNAYDKILDSREYTMSKI